MDYLSLKSGTDVRGAAIETPGAPVQLTDRAVGDIASAFLVWCEKRLNIPTKDLTVAVGRDSRLSGPRIAQALKEAFLARGVKCFDCGLASTPSMFMAVLDLPCHCAVQITASHHPYHRNGLKFFTADGGLDGGDIAEILELAGQGACPPPMDGGSWEPVDHMAQYAAHLRRIIQEGVNASDYQHPLAGFKIAVDAGNGAGGFYARDVLEPLGADISGSQFLEPDGRFPNHIPNPEDPEAMNSISQAVTASGADLGLIFDTDVDRAAVVDCQGREINRNRLVAVASAIALENAPGGTVVTDSITSDGLHTYIKEALGGVHRRFRRGYKNVINEALRLNAQGVDCPLAIETSGHAALRENHFLDDGAYLVTKILIKVAALRREGRELEDLLASLEEPAEAAEVRLPILDPDFRCRGEGVIAALEAYAKAQDWQIAPDNFEGIRVSFPEGQGQGWFLVRLSVHDPILPVNMESAVPGGVALIREKLQAFFQENGQGLDCSAL
ncbi:phosphomannomutase/phosphoglucomutase [Acutalibacter sp. 1XD8-33]|uniref:phosphomannomutase/phosphoglucomutase n=1 Tax=Acutalibacter sp. 1XD8-33 TaxID=2320081 RepID=UPI000EA276C3|nr:phosphomannomutase/phosphoglucomutase [Acutalibacter sp. 1XD8-33]RKJ38418.1 phosphomannomutase/phosphoglucomutase [Acutalibacter sp. 1XD8-33]